MMSITLSTSMRVGSLITFTSGLRAWMVSAPESTLGRPTLAVVWST
jgi:hypothetical protein